MNLHAVDLKFFIPRKFLRNLEDYGVRIAFQKTARYLMQPLYWKIEFIIYEIDLLQSRGKAIVNNNMEFKLIDDSAHLYIRQIEKMEEWLKGRLKSKLKSNGICLVALDGDRVAGFNLATRSEGYIKPLKMHITMKPDAAWSEHIAVHKHYRGKKLANDLRNRFYPELQKIGIQHLYGHRQAFNIASRASAKKYTARELGTATYRKFILFNMLVFNKKEGLKNSKIPVVKAGRNKKYPFSIDIDQLDS